METPWESHMVRPMPTGDPIAGPNEDLVEEHRGADRCPSLHAVVLEDALFAREEFSQ